MATKRTPIKRALQTRITAEAIDAFKAWRAVGECLNPDDEGYDCGECDVCEQWWSAHNAVHSALGLRPWVWPFSEEHDPMLWKELELRSQDTGRAYNGKDY